jgi:hypothetical protein
MKCAAYLAIALLGGAVGVARAQEEVDAGAASPAQVRCADGTTEAVGLDDCAEHGGLATEIGAPITKSTPATIESHDSTKVAPATPVTASPAMVRCKDGTSVELQPGACDTHGGLDKATSEAPRAMPGYAPTAVTARGNQVHDPKAELSTTPPATEVTAGARCRDGTLSYVMRHSPTCLGHAGVAEWYGTEL